MCTLILLNECVDGYPLVIAANRDERYNRRSRPPESVNCGEMTYLRPWDDEREGTWMGVAQDGWFVGLTNQDDGKHDSQALSRGKVVVDCLKARCHSQAARVLTNLDRPRYNPFNIVFGRPGAMFLTRVMPDTELEMLPMLPGITVVSNDCWGHQYDEKTEWAKGLVTSLVTDPAPGGIDVIRRYLLIAMGSHFESRCAKADPFQALCVHAEEHEFGTRSTSIITVSNEGNVEYWYSEGHPCQSGGLSLAGRLLHPQEPDAQNDATK